MRIESQAIHHQTKYSGEQRKLLGIHYTPEAVVEYIVCHSLRPYFGGMDSKSVRNISIVDPACGAGLFLLKAFELLCSLWEQRFGRFCAEDAQYILENNLYGVDVDKSAVQVTKENLAQKAKDFGVETVDLDHTIRRGDALMQPVFHPQLEMLLDVDTFANWSVEEPEASFNWSQLFPQIFAQGGFDCVIGNPPYIRIQHVQPPERRAKYVELYETARGRFDIAALFIELANNIAKPGGRIGYIVSNKLLSVNGASQLREFILTNQQPEISALYTLEEVAALVDALMGVGPPQRTLVRV